MNDDTIHYWTAVAGPAWARQRAGLDRMLAPLGLEAMARLGLGEGQRVVDVGCGCGDTVLAIARQVGKSGHVLGIDVSEPMLEVARARVRDAGAGPRVELRLADAASEELGSGYDALFSRFGVMFFSDPAAAFSNLRRALRPGGRLAFVCWQERADNPWLVALAEAAAAHLEMQAPSQTGEPGPFGLADRGLVRRVLESAGFCDVAISEAARRLQLAPTLEEAVALFVEVGPAGAALSRTNAPPEVRRRVADTLRAVLAPHASDAGVRMPCAAWIVEARSP